MAKHKVLIVGVGSIGERHLQCFIRTGRVEVGLCEINDDLRAAVAQRHDVPSAHVHASLEEAIRAGYTAAVICTPAHLHIQQAMTLVNCNLHVLIEKPLSTSLAGVEELQQAIRDKGVTAAVAYVQRSRPTFLAMRDLVASGRFGKPVQIVCVNGQNFPSFRPAYRDIYYARRASGGGAIQDALTHLLNAGEMVVGPISSLVADAEHKVLEGVDVEDTVNVLTRQGDVMGVYSLNQHQAPNEMVVTVICERGTVRLEIPAERLKWMTKANGEWHVEMESPLERNDLFVAQANAFLNAVEGKRPPACTLADGLQTLKVNLAALESTDAKAWRSIT